MNDSTKTQIHHSLKEATVKIFAEGKFQGSGFFVTPNGYLVTAYHCVAKPAMRDVFGKPMPQELYQTLEVETSPKVRWPAEVDKDKSFPDLDIAVLKISHSPKQYLLMGSVSKAMIGDKVVGCGCPGGNQLGMEEIAIYPGIFTRILTDDRELIEVQHAIIGHGQSGGAIYHDQSQRVIAIADMGFKDKTISTAPYAVRLDKLLEKWNVSTNPYRGLAAFRQADAKVFFGRNKEIEKLLELVVQRRFTALVGVSGSGKSSVVFAGLVPQLEESHWQVIECRPESHPFNRLAVALVKLLTSDKLEQAIKLKTLEEELPTGEKITLSHVVQIWQEESQKRLLLIIDQFEELYTANSTAVQQQFLACLLKLVNSDVPAVLLVTLRADFMSQALMYPEFAQALNGNTRFISSLSRAELEAVIEAPAAQVGLGLETGLTERILEDLGTAEGRLPLLQFALTSLFEKQRLGSLTHDAYTEIGGVEQALVRYADQVLAKFSATEHDQLRQIFVQLVHPGQGTEDTRLVVTYSQLADKWAMVKRLADSRLVVTGQNKETQEETVEVIHEALIRQWPRFQEWMKADRTFRVWQEAFQADLKRWQAMKQPRAELLRGAKLAQAEEMLNERQAELIEVEQTFIKASRQEQRRQKRVWQGVFVLLLGLLGVAGWQWWKAEKQTQVAEVQRNKAEQQAKIALVRQVGLQARMAADSPNSVNGYVDQSFLLAVQAFRFLGNLDTQSNLLHFSQNHSRLGKFLRSHRGGVKSVAFSPDGQWLASGSLDNSIILWDVKTGTPIGTPWQGHSSGVMSVAFSPDGLRLASGSGDNSIILWDVKTGMPIGTPWQGHSSSVMSVAFSPDGLRLVSGSLDNSIILWDVKTGTPIGTPWQGHSSGVMSVAFSPDGLRLASGSGDNSIILWDVKTGMPIGTPWQGHSSSVMSVAFSPDGLRLASGSWDSSIILWNVKTGTPIGTPWQGHRDPVASVAFSPDGLRLASGSIGANGNIILWDVKTSTHIGTLWQGHRGWVESVAFSPDGLRLASGSGGGSGDMSIILWDIKAGTPLGTSWQGHRERVSSVAFSPDGLQLASGSWDNSIILWDVKKGTPIGAPWQRHRDKVTTIAFSPDGLRLASGSEDKSIILWDVKTGTPIGTPWQKHLGKVTSITFSPNGLQLASGSEDKSIILWDVKTGTPIGTPWQRHLDRVTSIAFSPDGLRLVSGGFNDNLIILWDVKTGMPIGTPWQGHRFPMESVVFSPDGLRLVSGHWDSSITLWDVKTGTPIGLPWQGHRDPVASIAFSPDGLRLASGSGGNSDNSIILWNVETHTPIGQLWQEKDVDSVAFSPDGKLLASDNGNDVMIWDMDPHSWADKLCQKVNRNFTQEEWKRFFGEREYEKTCPGVE